MEHIVIAGHTGLIGTHLKASLGAHYRLTGLGRKELSMTAEQLAGIISGSAALINLAGAPIAGRWNRKRREEIFGSRINSTRKLADAIALAEHPPRVFVSASAVGIYDSKGHHNDHSLHYGNNFLAEICTAWEKEALAAEDKTRVVLMRFGVVLDRYGGALKKMWLPSAMGTGAVLGSGKQKMPWVHWLDATGAISFVMNHEIKGPVNVVAPEIHTNRSFQKTLGRVMRKPVLLRVPSFMLKLVFGEGAVVVLEGQEVIPEVLVNGGYSFRFSRLKDALEFEKNRKKA